MDEEDFLKLGNNIAKPTFSFFMKRLNKAILNNPDMQKMELNDFMNIFINCMAAICVNQLRWMENFYNIKTAQILPPEILEEAFLKSLQGISKDLSK